MFYLIVSLMIITGFLFEPYFLTISICILIGHLLEKLKPGWFNSLYDHLLGWIIIICLWLWSFKLFSFDSLIASIFASLKKKTR
jgi:hypothetical protein